jgi:molybdate transport system ATP-binding protein
MPENSQVTAPGVGLHLLVGRNGSGKSKAARQLAAGIAGAALLSSEIQQAFYERELANDDSNFQEATDHGTSVGELLGAVARSHPLLHAFGLDVAWERGYRLLSSGESRKLLLLRALLASPSLLVLDEPFDGLDQASRDELAQAVLSVAQALPVLVVGSFRAAFCPFPLAAVSGVTVVERGVPTFTGEAQAWLEHDASAPRLHGAPPVDEGSLFAALNPKLPLVELRRGCVRYGDFAVFEGLDFIVRAGEHTLIEGPNGSGKSTLLEMICGDHPQGYSNDLSLFGRRRGSGETVWDIKKNVGLVSPKLHRDYRVGGSVEDVLVSGLYDSIGVYREREPSHRARALRWLSWLELNVEPSHAFRELSFGEQRLVLIARAAIKVPPLVVLDEPTAGLDADNQARVLELIESLCSQQRSTVLFVTHRADEREFWNARIGGRRLTLGNRSRVGLRP